MNATFLLDGDLVEVTVTKNLPFGVLVETAARIPGMVPGVAAQVGDVVRVRIDEYDAVKHRFRGSMV